ncbi:AbiTii domain-containing protein [Sutcliffiella horikoshii]|uniref:AbiTii domain-containing protein n=1 Tax=Sutcliffiella horikoshii TaxID=79883 RepID=UPI0016536115|nr:hypothetical protein [Sutcliffiella horikoshii]
MKPRLDQALDLSEEILQNIEMEEIKLQSIIQKTLRLARLVNDMEAVEWVREEMKGFSRNETGKMTTAAWKSARKSNRIYYNKDLDGERAFTETVSVMEATIDALKMRMQAAQDPNVSVSSASTINPTIPNGNGYERGMAANEIRTYTGRIEKVKSSIYEYVFNLNFELKFSNITDDIFTRKRLLIDEKLTEISTEAVRRFVSVHENLRSTNAEDWANAVHSCRRILKDIADVLYPPMKEPVLAGERTIKIGEDQVINRLIQYVESKSSSNRYEELVGSHLKYLGERLDSVYGAANKGTHAEVSLEEAERYIIYTYLLIGDLLSL